MKIFVGKKHPIHGFTISAGAAIVLMLLSACNSTESGANCEEPARPPEPQIVLTAPKCGSFKVSSALHVKWELRGRGLQEITAVDVVVSHDDGQSWTYVRENSIAPGDPDWGDFAWTVPDSLSRLGVKHNLVGNERIRVKVEQYSTADPNQAAVSGRFSVTR